MGFASKMAKIWAWTGVEYGNPGFCKRYPHENGKNLEKILCAQVLMQIDGKSIYKSFKALRLGIG